MQRKIFFLFFFPFIFLEILLFRDHGADYTELIHGCRLALGFAGWVFFWFRMQYLRKRPELAILPALPLLLDSMNRFVFTANDSNGGSIPFFHHLMLLAWLGSTVITALACSPDLKKQNQRYRIDAVSIIMTVFICYLNISFAAFHMGGLAEG